MNLLLRESKFGFTKFSYKCPCIGGGGGGARICTTPHTQTKWTPNSTTPPKANTPSAIQDGSGCKKVYDGPTFGEKWDGEGPKEILGDSQTGNETCSPKEPLPPCACGSEVSNTEPETVPNPPEWDSGTDESKTFTIIFSCSYRTLLNPGEGCVTIGTAGSYGTDHDLTETVTVPGKRFNKKWDVVVTETKDCVP